MGNEAKPVQLKKLHGTYRKDRAPKNEMGVDPCPVMPPPPVYLSEVGVRVWHETTEQLSALKMLHTVDLELLAAYCLAAETMEKMATDLKVEGHTVMMQNKGGGVYQIKNPKWTILNESIDKMHKIALQFGWTPAARAKISVPDQGEEKDPFAKLEAR